MGIINLEGADAVGKETQFTLLRQVFERRDISHRGMSFPNYRARTGELVQRYLRGDLSEEFKGFSPYSASLPFALDRAAHRDEIARAAQDGHLLLDRYVPSNLVYQAARLDTWMDRQAFILFLEQLEYETLRLPRPDIVIYLHVPVEYAGRLLKARGEKFDGNESNEGLQRKVNEIYQKLASERDNWHVVECVASGRLLSKDVIHERVWFLVEPVLSSRAA